MKTVYHRATAKVLSLALGMTAMAGVSAQTVAFANAQAQQDFFTCMATEGAKCAQVGGSQEEMMACVAQAIQTCMGGGAGDEE